MSLKFQGAVQGFNFELFQGPLKGLVSGTVSDRLLGPLHVILVILFQEVLSGSLKVQFPGLGKVSLIGRLMISYSGRSFGQGTLKIQVLLLLIGIGTSQVE